MIDNEKITKHRSNYDPTFITFLTTTTTSKNLIIKEKPDKNMIEI